MKVRLIAATLFAMGLIYLGVSSTDSRTKDAGAADQVGAGTTAGDDPQLRKLRGYNPKLRLTEATFLVADENGTVWLVPSDGGQLCLVRAVVDGGRPVGADFACKDAAQADTHGIVLGAPGEYYGYAPHGATVTAKVGGAARAIAPTSSGGFRLPPEASEVTVGGGAPAALVR
ncbi:MAG TPA: hypothetical protein VF529_03445 [Solirubrobacteraceae bacterium]|jgi:hypothetical protein